jgi:hypothetical protein
MQSTMQAYLQRNQGAGGPSGYMYGQPNNMYGYQQYDQNGYPQQQQQQQKRPSAMSTAMDVGSGYLQDEGSSYLFGSGGSSAATPASNAAWNGAGMASGAGGSAALGGSAGAGAMAGLGSGVSSGAGGTILVSSGGAVPAGYTAVGSAAGGGVVAAPSSAAGAGAAAGGSTAGTVASYAWPVAAAITAYKSYNNYRAAKKNANGGAMTKDETRSIYDPWRPVADKIPGVKQFNDLYFGKLAPEKLIFGTLLGSHKDDDQLYRDRVRKNLKDSGAIDKDYKINFSDGSSFDIGKDGGYRNDKGMRQFELDHEHPSLSYQGNTIANLSLLGDIMTGGKDKLRDDYTGYLTNAALQNTSNEAQAMGHVRELYGKQGVDQTSALAAVDELLKAGRIDPQRADVYRAGVSRVFGGAPQPQATNGRAPAPIAPGNQGGVIGAASGMPGNIDPGFTKPIGKLPTVFKTQVPPRSSTSSPGIGKDGQRLQIPRARR